MVYLTYKVFSCWNQYVTPCCSDFEEHVHRRLVDSHYLAQFACSGIVDTKAHEIRPRIVDILIVGHQRQGEVNFRTGILLHILYRIYVQELQQRGMLATETVLLQEERHQDAIHHQHQIVGIYPVPHIGSEGESYLSLHSVGLPQLADMYNLLLVYQLIRVICAPKAFSRASMFW